jgi:hypothetical protein
MSIICLKKFESEGASQPWSIHELKHKILFYEEIIRHEYIESKKQNSIDEMLKDRLVLLSLVGEIKLLENDKIQMITDKEKKPFTFIEFMAGIGLYMLDTYLIVLYAVNEVNNSNYVIREENLINELHMCIQNMYSDGII